MSACEYVHEYRSLRRPEALNPLELELQEAATHLMRVLGTKLDVLVATEPSHQLLTFLMKNIWRLESYNSLTGRIKWRKATTDILMG